MTSGRTWNKKRGLDETQTCSSYEPLTKGPTPDHRRLMMGKGQDRLSNREVLRKGGSLHPRSLLHRCQPRRHCERWVMQNPPLRHPQPSMTCHLLVWETMHQRSRKPSTGRDGARVKQVHPPPTHSLAQPPLPQNLPVTLRLRGHLN
jgi:hypothetical protein